MKTTTAEHLQGRVVTQRLQLAAMRIEGQAVSDLPAESAEEWLERNLPDVWRKVQR